jgi:hypothetical protein
MTVLSVYIYIMKNMVFGDLLLLLRNFRPYVMIFMCMCVCVCVCVCCYHHYHGVWSSFNVKGFCTLWDNIITVGFGSVVKGILLYTCKFVVAYICIICYLISNLFCFLLHLVVELCF